MIIVQIRCSFLTGWRFSLSTSNRTGSFKALSQIWASFSFKRQNSMTLVRVFEFLRLRNNLNAFHKSFCRSCTRDRSFGLFAAPSPPFECTYSVTELWQQWWSNTTEQYYVILCCLALWKPLWCMNWRVLAWECHLYTCQCPQPCDPELDWGILSEPPGPAARPTISWPHSRWLDSCRPRPVVSIGSAHEAKAASRQQQQYTERARYTDDSSITCRLVKWSVFILPRVETVF